MNPAVGAVFGFVLGSLPTADLIGRAFGLDLRSSGTGNPGTANALQLGGPKPAATILLFDIAKGVLAVVVSSSIGGDGAALAAGIAAIGGQVLNPWFRFRGGKGLGVAAGVTAAAWPVPLPGFILIIGLGARALGSAAKGALVALVAYAATGAVWWSFDLPNAWGVGPDAALFAFAAGVALLLTPKFALDVARR